MGVCGGGKGGVEGDRIRRQNSQIQESIIRQKVKIYFSESDIPRYK